MQSADLMMRVIRSSHDGFENIKDTNVLIYWPHGFGDWVFLSYVLPFLDQSNRYFFTRFGDDNTSLFEHCSGATPLYVGVNSTHGDHGGVFGMRHFRLTEGNSNLEREPVHLPLALAEACRSHNIHTLVHMPFPETYGGSTYPFHTKARNMIRHFRPTLPLEDVLSHPIRSSLSFRVPSFVTRWVESRLRSWMGMRRQKLCLIGRGGYTSVGKNWGHLWREDMPREKRREGEECRDFMHLLRKRDPKWIFVTIEDRVFSGDDTVRDHALPCFSFAELFGTPDDFKIPFGTLLTALINLADLVVGVPAGPYHLAMAKSDLPVIGLWTEHFPSWYDEPKSNSLHLMSNNLVLSGADRRVGSFSEKGNLRYDLVRLPTRLIRGEDVVGAVEQLLDI